MSFVSHIAERLLNGGVATDRRLSGPVVKVSTLAVSLGMMVMIVAICIGTGFKEEIRDKIVGFGSNIVISKYNINQSYETNPMYIGTSLPKELKNVSNVTRISPYIIKAGIIKTKDAVQGIALKGVTSDYDTCFFSSILIEGKLLDFTNNTDSISSSGSTDIMLSSHVAEMLGLKLHDAVRIYFIQNGVRARKFTLTGIFNSHFTEFDDRFAVVDIQQLRRLNNWDNLEASGLEIGVNKFDNIESVASDILQTIINHEEEGDRESQLLKVQTIKEIESQMFAWLDLLDTNILVILALIIAVASLNMISGLLILILEKTQTIGLLKTMGAPDKMIQGIFIRMAIRIIGRGMIWGNIIGLTLCSLQCYTHTIPLDPANYYLDSVPIAFPWTQLIILNIFTIVLTTLSLVGPSFVVTKISPAHAIRIE